MRIFKDGFIYKVITLDKAMEVYYTNSFELYVLHDDESESLIESEEALLEANEKGWSIGMPVGMLDTEDAKKVLDNRGFSVDNLWSVHDVHSKFECDGATAKSILHNTLNSEYIMQTINGVIADYIESITRQRIRKNG